MKLIWQLEITQKNGAAYMTRWGIMSQWLTIYVHRYAAGDGGRDMHDHPWVAWFSLVLRGWLNECRQRPDCSDTDMDRKSGMPVLQEQKPVTVHRQAWSLCGCSGDIKHRIISVLPDTLTLFIGWRRVREWGFIDDQGAKRIFDRRSSR